MGESQCPTCHHVVTGFEHETFEAGLSVLKAKDDEIARLRSALQPFAEPHIMGDAYVTFAPRLIEAARAALK